MDAKCKRCGGVVFEMHLSESGDVVTDCDWCGSRIENPKFTDPEISTAIDKVVHSSGMSVNIYPKRD